MILKFAVLMNGVAVNLRDVYETVLYFTGICLTFVTLNKERILKNTKQNTTYSGKTCKKDSVRINLIKLIDNYNFIFHIFLKASSAASINGGAVGAAVKSGCVPICRVSISDAVI